MRVPFDPGTDLPDPFDIPPPPEDDEPPLPEPWDLPDPPDIEDPFPDLPSLFPDAFDDLPDIPLPPPPVDDPLPLPHAVQATPRLTAGPAVNTPIKLMPFPRPLLFPAHLTTFAGATKVQCDPTFSTTVLMPESNKNTLAFVGTCPHAVTARVQVGNGPVSVVAAPDAKNAWVANSVDGTISVVNFSSMTTVKTIPLTAPDGSAVTPNQVVFLPDASLAYVSDHACSPGSFILIINVATMQQVGSIRTGCFPSSMAVSPDGSQLWVSQRGDSRVDVYDTLTNAHVFASLIRLPTGISFNPTGTRVYIASGDSPGSLYVFDTATYKNITQIPLGNLPHAVKVTPTGRHVFVTNMGSNSISEIRTDNNAVVFTVQLTAQHRLGLAFIR